MTWLDTSTGDPPEDGWYRFRGPDRPGSVHRIENGMVAAYGVKMNWQKVAGHYPINLPRYWPEPVGFPDLEGSRPVDSR